MPGLGTGTRERLGLAGLAAVLLLGYGLVTRHGPALADEYVYLAGARHFALTGSLDARFYDAQAILLRGHPHQDVHSPGYVILLGFLMSLVRGGYRTAVALNIAAYLASALLVHQLARGLGFGGRAARCSGALYLILPAYLPFVFWAMPEAILGMLFLGALVLAVRWGDRAAGAVLAGLVLGLGFLVRESFAFGALAAMAILRDRGKLRPFLATLALCIVLVHLPLSRDRAPGGVNFWADPPATAKPGGFAAVHAAQRGDLSRAFALGWDRLRSNVRRTSEATATEKGILALFILLPLWALAGHRAGGPLARRFLLGLAAGWAALLVCLLFLFVVGRWAGFRYLMFLMPGFLPWAGRTLEVPGPAFGRWAFPAATALACLTLDASVLEIHNQYKASRQQRQERLSGYVERYIGARPLTRVALPDGWGFGLRHYPAEVISSLPEGGGQLRALERAVWFDYLVLPGDSPLADEWDGRLRYLRVNRDDPEPPLKIYRRLR